ncbi:transposase [Streptomyces sp. BE308]|uniref:transposase n=1 Tax=Streptomyces sp. BE308 TaxID=3002529 RepID=UPI002E774353|nr:transposase [Streptomyces sp. BE308]MEE1792745.1 transposase [Streptomyces sp. BE308]
MSFFDIQSDSRTEQQTQDWLSRYSLRAAAESTISEFVNGHGIRQYRYRAEGKARVQHVLTGAVNLERIDVPLPPAPARQPRHPTALQGFLDQQRFPRSRQRRHPPTPQAELVILKVAASGTQAGRGTMLTAR